jgi:hypothetical protein
MNSFHQSIGRLLVRKVPLSFDAAEMVHKLARLKEIPSLAM